MAKRKNESFEIEMSVLKKEKPIHTFFSNVKKEETTTIVKQEKKTKTTTTIVKKEKKTILKDEVILISSASSSSENDDEDSDSVIGGGGACASGGASADARDSHLFKDIEHLKYEPPEPRFPVQHINNWERNISQEDIDRTWTNAIQFMELNGWEDVNGEIQHCFESTLSFPEGSRPAIDIKRKRLRRTKIQISKGFKFDREPRLRLYLSQLALLKKNSPEMPSLGKLHGSHLCGNKLCFNPEHIIVESVKDNMARKNCLCFIIHKGDRISVCSHTPKCIHPQTWT